MIHPDQLVALVPWNKFLWVGIAIIVSFVVLVAIAFYDDDDGTSSIKRNIDRIRNARRRK